MSGNRRGFLPGVATATAAGTVAMAGSSAADTTPSGAPLATPSVVQPVTVYDLRELEERVQQVLPRGAKAGKPRQPGSPRIKG